MVNDTTTYALGTSTAADTFVTVKDYTNLPIVGGVPAWRRTVYDDDHFSQTYSRKVMVVGANLYGYFYVASPVGQPEAQIIIKQGGVTKATMTFNNAGALSLTAAKTYVVYWECNNCYPAANWEVVINLGNHTANQNTYFAWSALGGIGGGGFDPLAPFGFGSADIFSGTTTNMCTNAPPQPANSNAGNFQVDTYLTGDAGGGYAPAVKEAIPAPESGVIVVMNVGIAISPGKLWGQGSADLAITTEMVQVEGQNRFNPGIAYWVDAGAAIGIIAAFGQMGAVATIGSPAFVGTGGTLFAYPYGNAPLAAVGTGFFGYGPLGAAISGCSVIYDTGIGDIGADLPWPSRAATPLEGSRRAAPGNTALPGSAIMAGFDTPAVAIASGAATVGTPSSPSNPVVGNPSIPGQQLAIQQAEAGKTEYPSGGSKFLVSTQNPQSSPPHTSPTPSITPIHPSARTLGAN